MNGKLTCFYYNIQLKIIEILKVYTCKIYFQNTISCWKLKYLANISISKQQQTIKMSAEKAFFQMQHTHAMMGDGPSSPCCAECGIVFETLKYDTGRGEGEEWFRRYSTYDGWILCKACAKNANCVCPKCKSKLREIVPVDFDFNEDLHDREDAFDDPDTFAVKCIDCGLLEKPKRKTNKADIKARSCNSPSVSDDDDDDDDDNDNDNDKDDKVAELVKTDAKVNVQQFVEGHKDTPKKPKQTMADAAKEFKKVKEVKESKEVEVKKGRGNEVKESKEVKEVKKAQGKEGKKASDTDTPKASTKTVPASITGKKRTQDQTGSNGSNDTTKRMKLKQ